MMVCNLQEFIENIPDPAKSAMWKSEVMKATLKLGLDAAWKEVGDNTGNVTLQLKPVKRLLAARALAVGQLRLVALSPVVAMYCEGQKVPAAAVAVPSCDPGDATKAHVLPKAVGAKAAGSTSDVGAARRTRRTSLCRSGTCGPRRTRRWATCPFGRCPPRAGPLSR